MNKVADVTTVSEQIRSELRVSEQGHVSFSIRALSRICGIDESSLRQQLKCEGAGLQLPKIAEILINQGFDVRGFGSTGIPDTAAGYIIDYYANLAGRNCTEFAKSAQRAFSVIGVRKWGQTIAGWSEKNSESVSVSTTTAESMFSKMMEMEQKMNQLLNVAENQVKVLTAQVEEQKLITAEKQEIIDDMVEKEDLREVKFLKYPGLKEATDYALGWDEEEDEEIFFTLRQFCDVNGISLTHGQKIQIGKLATDFCRMAVMRKLPKNMSNHTLYSSRFEPMVKLAIIEVLNLKR